MFKEGLGIKYFFSYLLDSKKRLWLAGQDFIKVSKPNDWSDFTYVSTNEYGYACAINEDSSKNVWVGTDEGLLKIKDISFSTIDKINDIAS